MAHLKKFNRSQTSRIIDHCERKNKVYGNEKIDQNKTALNYSFVENGHERLKKRLSEVHCINRKDVNVCCSWVVTLPAVLKDLSEENQRVFFKKTFNFLKKRYGEKNVISATVHYDETTPHLHFSFVPVVFDEKKERYKVSAKERVNRADLQSFHKDLEQEFEMDLGIRNGITKNLGNRTVEQLKSENYALEQKNELLREEMINLEVLLKNYQKKADKLKIELTDMVNTIPDIEDFVEEYKDQLSRPAVSLLERASDRPKGSLLERVPDRSKGRGHER